MKLNDNHIFIFFAFQVLTLVISAKEGPKLLYTPQYDIILFNKLYDALTSQDYDKELAGIVEIRKMLESPDPSYDGFERSGILRRLVEHLSSEKDITQYESASAIATLCSKGYSYLVVESDGISHLFNTLLSFNETIQQQGVLAFGYIMGHNPDYRDKCIEEGVVFHLNRLIFSSKTPEYLLANVSWAMSNLCKGADEYMDEEAINEILPALTTLIQHNNPKILQYAVASYGYLAGDGGKFIQMVIDSGRVENIIGLLNHTDVKVQFAAAGTVSILLTGNQQQIQRIIDYGALPQLIKLLIHPKQDLKINSLQALYNLVTYGNPKQIEALLKLNVISLICDLLDNCSRKVVKKSLDIIHILLGKSENIREIIGKHVNEWGGFEKLEEIMDKTISRLHDEDNGISQGTCSR
jgi:importin subunit alpha-1